MKSRSGPANARLAALNAISAVLDDQQSLSDHFQATSSLEPRDQAFARHLSYGVLRWLTALEWLTDQLLNKPLKRKERDIRRLVMIGIFQLWKDATADHAAVHATSECARQLGKPWAVGLINALLRRFQREQSDFLTKLAEQADQYSHPKWLLKQLQQDWPDQWQEIVGQNNIQAGLWLRLNRNRAELDQYLEEISELDFTTRTHPQAADAIRIEPAVPVQKLPGFSAGKVSVQDPAAQLAADFVHPQPGEYILDACSAPGGKTCHLLERQPDIKLLALDRDPERIKMVRENLDRLGLDCELKAADAAKPETWWDGTLFDKILLDAPCSTTGVIRRHPDIKWLRDPSQVHSATVAQNKLLEALWPLLRAGGMLVYATCSILKSENYHQAHGFLSRHSDANIISATKSSDSTGLLGQQILPGEDGMDGFYYALIRKSD
ncbi:MAG: 16S rRNA (cytosine967-C5)-methyltransferase [Lysobacterales bacterium]|jgi:16S rRNA (cytosine967-C5)-methyltransferase